MVFNLVSIDSDVNLVISNSIVEYANVVVSIHLEIFKFNKNALVNLKDRLYKDHLWSRGSPTLPTAFSDSMLIQAEY